MLWYVLHVKTGAELDVRQRLEQAHVTAAVPQEERPIRSGGKWGKKQYTLFPGYVFVRLDITPENYYLLKRTDDVISILKYGDQPAPLSYLEAEWITLLNGGGKPLQASEIDASGKVISGILTKFETRIVKIDRHAKRATVALSLCGEEKKVKLGITV